MKAEHSKESDEALALLVQKGDKEKFGTLMERYEAKLFRYARKFLSREDHIEDVVQEVFVKAYENILSFDASQKFSPWIYRIAHNAYVNALKKKSRNPITFFDFDTFGSHPAYIDPAEEEREASEIKEMLGQSLAALRPSEREIIVLHYIEGLSYREISDVLHVPMGTTSVRLKRAKEALKKEYDKLDNRNEQ